MIMFNLMTSGPILLTIVLLISVIQAMILQMHRNVNLKMIGLDPLVVVTQIREIKISKEVLMAHNHLWPQPSIVLQLP